MIAYDCEIFKNSHVILIDYQRSVIQIKAESVPIKELGIPITNNHISFIRSFDCSKKGNFMGFPAQF